MALATLDTSEILLADTDESPAGLDGDGPDPRGGQRRRTRSATGGKRSAGSSARASGPTGAKELASVLAKVIGGASMILALFLVGPTEAETVAMTPAEADAIAKPAARMLAKSALAKRAAALAARGGDAIDLALALAGYALRVYPLILLRQAELAAAQKRGNVYVHPGSAESLRSTERTAGPASAPAHGGRPGDASNFAAAVGGGYRDPDATQAGAYGDVAAAFAAATGLQAGPAL